MDQQNSTIESSSPSNDELEIQETEPIITTATTSESLLSSLSIPKTARDKFFEDLQHEKDKNRWSAKCLLCEKPKRVIDKLEVTSNFTRYAREYHKEHRIVTDSAANNIRTFQGMIIPGFEQYFVEDDNDEINDEDDSESDMNNGEISDEYEYPSDFSSTTISSSTYIDLTLNDLIQESFNRLMENNEVFRIPCFAYTIQLVVKEGLQETKSILGALEKVSLITKLAHTNTKFAEKLDLMKVSIPRAVITR
ncbi:unnamed protein product [Rotaria sp. Silwood1]|nr:unnamed protein product [Rotaria sp. Silwood1]CAF4834160.1 unnamed protein product [Rotaria sp. Silwood1]